MSDTLQPECKFYNSDFIIVSSLASFYIPCVIILVLYYKIMRAIIRHDGRVKPVGKKRKRNRRQKAARKRAAEEVSEHLIQIGPN